MILRERAWEELVRLVSLNEVQAVLSQICDYSPVSVNAVLELLFKLTSFNKLYNYPLGDGLVRSKLVRLVCLGHRSVTIVL